MKKRIIRWLGIEALIDRMMTERETMLRAEFEARSALVLEAAITAALKIARIVESEGQERLKEYMDEQFKVIVH